MQQGIASLAPLVLWVVGLGLVGVAAVGVYLITRRGAADQNGKADR